jgi:ectoine hydroxylase-related dioxygenase (phytanoyl-CoA dioxygenase family)
LIKSLKIVKHCISYFDIRNEWVILQRNRQYLRKEKKELQKMKNNFADVGFAVIEDVYTDSEISQLLAVIENGEQENNNFRKSKDLFAIRQFFKEFPATLELVFNSKLRDIISQLVGNEYFVSKSIYFDKPEKSNWFVAYHQDLTISVDNKTRAEGFINWTSKQDQFAVQPPVELLEKNFTIRIHLDHTTAQNGSLRIIEESHKKGVLRTENIDFLSMTETVCEVPKGGIMLMKPLLLHASNKTSNQARRRVLHIEFSDQELPNGMNWREKVDFVNQTF